MAAGPVFNHWLRFPILLLGAFIFLAGSCQKGTVGGKKDFGLIGDGKSDDTEALQRLLQKGGKITIPKGTYRISRTMTVNPKTLEVEAEGVTIIAAPRSTYNLLSVQSPNVRFVWKGGTFDGNKAQQVYPGHPNGKFDGKWKQTITNNGMIGNQNFDAEYVLIENVVLKNFVSDGSCIRADEAEYRNCKAYDSAIPTKRYPQAFKFRSDGISDAQKRVFRVSNCLAENTYIGIGTAAKEVGKKTQLYIDNFNSRQTTKSSIHLEHIAYAYIKNIKCLASGGDQFSSRIHIGNQNVEFHLEDFEMTGGFIRGPKNSEVFKISNGNMSNSQNFDYAIRQGPKTEEGQVANVIVSNCVGGIRAKNITSCEVENASGCAFEKAKLVEGCRVEKAAVGTLNCVRVSKTTFSNTKKGIHQIRGRQRIEDCQFKQCDSPVVVEENAEIITIANSNFTDWDQHSIKIDVAKQINIKGNTFKRTNAGKSQLSKSSSRNAKGGDAIAVTASNVQTVLIENNETEGITSPFLVPQVNKQKLKQQNRIR